LYGITDYVECQISLGSPWEGEEEQKSNENDDRYQSASSYCSEELARQKQAMQSATLRCTLSTGKKK